MDGVKEAVVGRHLAQLQSELSGRPLRWSHDQLAEGLQTAIDNNFFTDGKHADWITLAVDNDTGGHNFIDSLREKGATINEDLPDLQPGQDKTDWNDALKQHRILGLSDGRETYQTRSEEQEVQLKDISTLHSEWKQELKNKVTQHLGHTPQWWELERNQGAFLTTELDQLFAKRSSLELDAHYADNSRYVRQQIKKLDEQILMTIQQEKAPEKTQEQITSEQHKKNETNIRDLSEQAQEAAPLPEVTPSQPLKDLSPSQTESHSLLHFTIENPKRSIYKDNYHPIKTHELNKLNHHAPNIQSAAQWYLDNLSDTTLHYFYQQGNKQYNINIEFEQYHFMHLTGLFPLKRGQTAVKTLHDFAEGRGTYDNLMIADNEAAFQKIKVLPDLKAIMETDAFYFDQMEDIPKLQSLSLEKAIKSDDKDVLLAFSSNEENIYPASLMELTKQLKIQTEQSQHQNVILGVYQERDGKFTQLSINEAYITDNGEEMLSILKGEQVSSDEPSHDLTPSPAEALIDAATFTKVLDTAYNVGNPADLGVEVPEEFQASWEQYNQLSEASLGDFKTIIAKADELGLLDKTTAFYQDWQQDQIYNDTYHVRLRSSNEGPNSPQLPFEPTHLVSYQDFVTEVYKANQDVSRTKPIAFDIYAPGGALIKEGVRYAIGDETQPVSRLLGLGYRRLEDYPNLAAIDEKVLSQLENQEVNQSIATEANEQTVASQETPQERDSRENFQSPKQGVKNGLAQRVEEIMAEDATKILISSIPQVQENLSIEVLPAHAGVILSFSQVAK
ncbi:PBECR4 domain-containing protein [Streptococcus ratti]|uniref:Phage-Barnase-EndoU-ColicinE5/D-RelE like nuclease 4 domain-containing protein n=1 Tax=Streptococcus ratti FA-1 = DSM 20564 TaxID=699248 RepID=A0ABP2QYM9_STRRT|nr:PBECR4 domain-containing protein [Streptococcus ratti]EJN94193.1 hypothetical protein SRA_06646 [Streptococcus ratti FA-1 = DSM 20564]